MNARRTPTQARAHQTIEVILEATAQLLVEDGLHRLSTNRIARRAGVSVGTLYQYFSDKEAVVNALGEQVLERQFQEFERDLLGLVGEGDDLEDAVRALISGVLEHKRIEPELTKVLLDAGAVGTEEWNQRWLRRLRDLVRSALHLHRDSVRAGDHDVMAYVIVTAFEFVFQDAMKHSTHLLRDGRLADELVELSIRYLRADAT